MRKIKVSVAILKNELGEVLLQKKTSDWEWMPNSWICFGGHIDEGESPKECIVRELNEELGVELSPKELFFQETEIAKDVVTEMHVFESLISLSQITKITEGSGLAFFSKEELSNLKIFHDTKRALEKYFNSNF